MSKRLALALAALLAAAIAAFAGAGPAAAIVPTCDCGAVIGDATPLSPDDASVLANAPGSGGVTDAAAVDPATALAAASAPGADTAIESDLTPEEAAGVAPSRSAAVNAAAPTMCWSDQAWYQWGTWPYQQRITDTTYWCAVYGAKITLRSSSIGTSGALCGVNWRSSQLIGGGTGFPSFAERSSAGFACPTVIPWLVLHPSHHLDVLRDSRGGAQITGSG